MMPCLRSIKSNVKSVKSPKILQGRFFFVLFKITSRPERAIAVEKGSGTCNTWMEITAYGKKMEFEEFWGRMLEVDDH